MAVQPAGPGPVASARQGLEFEERGLGGRKAGQVAAAGGLGHELEVFADQRCHLFAVIAFEESEETDETRMHGGLIKAPICDCEKGKTCDSCCQLTRTAGRQELAQQNLVGQKTDAEQQDRAAEKEAVEGRFVDRAGTHRQPHENQIRANQEGKVKER